MGDEITLDKGYIITIGDGKEFLLLGQIKNYFFAVEMTTRTEEKNSYYTLFNKVDAYIREYTYNNSGLLEKEIYTVITDKDSYGENESMSSITYEYDKEDRLIKEIHDDTNA